MIKTNTPPRASRSPKKASLGIRSRPATRSKSPRGQDEAPQNPPDSPKKSLSPTKSRKMGTPKVPWDSSSRPVTKDSVRIKSRPDTKDSTRSGSLANKRCSLNSLSIEMLKTWLKDATIQLEETRYEKKERKIRTLSFTHGQKADFFEA